MRSSSPCPCVQFLQLFIGRIKGFAVPLRPSFDLLDPEPTVRDPFFSDASTVAALSWTGVKLQESITHGLASLRSCQCLAVLFVGLLTLVGDIVFRASLQCFCVFDASASGFRRSKLLTCRINLLDRSFGGGELVVSTPVHGIYSLSFLGIDLVAFLVRLDECFYIRILGLCLRIRRRYNCHCS